MQYIKCTNKRTGKSVILPNVSSINIEEVKDFTSKYLVDVWTYSVVDKGFVVFTPEEAKTVKLFFKDDKQGDVYNFESLTTNENI